MKKEKEGGVTKNYRKSKEEIKITREKGKMGEIKMRSEQRKRWKIRKDRSVLTRHCGKYRAISSPTVCLIDNLNSYMKLGYVRAVL